MRAPVKRWCKHNGWRAATSTMHAFLMAAAPFPYCSLPPLAPTRRLSPRPPPRTCTHPPTCPHTRHLPLTAVGMERATAFLQARAGQLPPRLLSDFPEEAAVILSLLQPDPTERPTASQLLAQPLLVRTMQVAAAANVARSAGAQTAAAGDASGVQPPHMQCLTAAGTSGRPCSNGGASSSSGGDGGLAGEGGGSGCRPGSSDAAQAAENGTQSGSAAAATVAASSAGSGGWAHYQGVKRSAAELVELLLERDREVAALRAQLDAGCTRAAVQQPHADSL